MEYPDCLSRGEILDELAVRLAELAWREAAEGWMDRLPALLLPDGIVLAGTEVVRWLRLQQ